MLWLARMVLRLRRQLQAVHRLHELPEVSLRLQTTTYVL